MAAGALSRRARRAGWSSGAKVGKGGLRCLAAGAAILAILAASEGHAAQRTFVASTGLDTNPCSLTQPCRTFGAAIAMASDGGEVVVLDSSGYGTFKVTKSVTIAAPAGVYAGISVPANQHGADVDAPGAVVVLRGLSFNGTVVGGVNTNEGIHFAHGAELRVERCEISGMYIGLHADFDSGATLYARDTSASFNYVGIWLEGAGHASLERVRSQGNAEGVFLKNVADVAIRDADIDNNPSGTVDALSDLVSMAVTITGSRLAYGCNPAVSATSSGAPVGALVTETDIEGGSYGCGFGGVLSSGSGGGLARAYLVRDRLSGNNGAVATSGAGAVAYLDGSVLVSNPYAGFSIDAAGGPIYTRLNNTIRDTTAGPNVIPYPAR